MPAGGSPRVSTDRRSVRALPEIICKAISNIRPATFEPARAMALAFRPQSPTSVASGNRLLLIGWLHLGWREQALLADHQIGQGEQGVKLRGVLGWPAIAQLFVAEEVLDDVEGVLNPGPQLPNARSTGSARARSAFGKALMMPRLTAMFHHTWRSACSGRLAAPV